MSWEGGERSYVERSRQLKVREVDGEIFEFESTLVDRSHGGWYEQPAESVVIHDFVISGRLRAPDLELLSLHGGAFAHPYPACPAALAVCEALVGHRLADGWRRKVLERSGGAQGCTHVTTLLLALTDVTTMIYFLRTNRRLPFGPGSRSDGSWTAEGKSLTPALDGACHVMASELAVRLRAPSGSDTDQ
jgi:hypothetical protein